MVIFTGRVSAQAKARGSLGTHAARWARPGLSILVFLLSVLLLPGCNSAGIPTEASNTLDETVLSLSDDEIITPAGVDDESPSLNFEASRVFCCNPLAYAFTEATTLVFTLKVAQGANPTSTKSSCAWNPR